MNQFYITYPNGKFKALTFSYDDGQLADRRLVTLFNRYGLKGTFHLNGGLLAEDDSSWRIKKEEVGPLYEGHEVACHTYTHPTIARSPIEKVAQEVLEDRAALEEVVGYPVQGFSYPNGSYNQAIKNLLPLLGIEYGRVVGNSDNFSHPEDWYHWQATCHHNHNLMTLGERFNNLDKKQYLHLMYVWGHSFEFDLDQNWELIENFAKLVSNQEDVWYVTNIDYKRYMSDAERLVFTHKGDLVYNPNAQPIWVSVNNVIQKIDPGMNNIDIKN